MERCLLAAIANGGVTLAYTPISFHVLRGVRRGGPFRDNPLRTATGLIFATCAAGHVGHLGHLLDPATRDARAAIYDWHLTWIDAVTATIVTRYWLLPRRIPALVHGVALFDHLTEHRRQVLTIHDQIVQQIITANLAIELGEIQEGITALERGPGTA